MGQKENKSDANGDHIVEDSALLVHGSSASSPSHRRRDNVILTSCAGLVNLLVEPRSLSGLSAGLLN